MILPAMLLFLPSLLLLVVAASSLWAFSRPFSPSSLIRWAGLTLFAFLFLDGGLIAALPHLGLSFGPVGGGLFYLAVARLGLYLPFFLIFNRRRTGRPRLSSGKVLAFFWSLHLALLVLEVDAFYIEPFALQTTHLSIVAPDLSRPLRLVQLSDLHIERLTRREEKVLARLEALRPDLIVLTGDYINLADLRDPQSQSQAREFLARLHAPLGVYAVSGNTDGPETMRRLFEGLDIVVLDDRVERLPAAGEFYLVGVRHRGREQDAMALKRLMETLPPEAFALLLYHTPDLVETAAETGVELYLAGHTHGGQVRLPFYGAILTFSAYGKRYEAGLYQVGPTTLYVSRGIGMEGLWFTPRVRFLCPPEMVVVELWTE